jgi:two-component system, NtrC family, nitrogen regulation response regulator NtrX
LRILLVEDESLVVDLVKNELSQHSLLCLESLVDWDGRVFEKWGAPDLIFLDLKSSKDPEAQGTLQKISQLKQVFPNCEIWIQSGSDDLRLMRECARRGAYKFVLKPHFVQQIPLILEWVSARKERREILAKRFIGSSSAMTSLREEILSLQDVVTDILIEGETGAGKELCAQSFVGSSQPFVALNVSAIPAELFEGEIFGYEKGAFSGAQASKEGLFEAAGEGVLFLDEIQSLALDLQSKLLRVLETRQFRRLGSTRERHFLGRVVCASNVNLKEAVQRGEFREDLYYRLAPVTVNVPPLRVRSEDIPALVADFMSSMDVQGQFRLNEEALHCLQQYEWPGNVRELRGLLKAMISKVPYPTLGREEVEKFLAQNDQKLLRNTSVELDANAFDVDWAVGLDANVRRFEEWMMRKVLSESDGLEARERLGLKRSRFYEKMKQYNLLS